MAIVAQSFQHIHDSQYRIGGIYSTSDHNSHSLNQESKNIGSLSLIDKQNFTLFPSVPLLQPTVQLSVFKLRLSRYFDSNALEILLCNHQTSRETKYKHFYLCSLLVHFTNKIYRYRISHLMVGLPMSIYWGLWITITIFLNNRPINRYRPIINYRLIGNR